MMHNPPHPGEIIREECLAPLNMSVTAAAEALGVSRKTVSELVNEKAAVTPEMAIRLAAAFGTSAEVWVNLQAAHDLWQASQRADEIRSRVRVVTFPTRAARDQVPKVRRVGTSAPASRQVVPRSLPGRIAAERAGGPVAKKRLK
ncbi:MAG: HigA family addiction module antidote protein [Deltaproteobacteria bacterium]|nr:HigA family addiction module antidote protein [Deltaproteobacteria bacterium]